MMPLCECKQKWCAQCNPARGFTEGMPVAEVVTNQYFGSAERMMRDPMSALSKAAERSNAIPIPDAAPLNRLGWICPLCRCGVSPKIEVCPCSATQK